MNRQLSIGLLFFAQVLLLLHNFIPHHHHEPFESLGHHGHTCQHHSHADERIPSDDSLILWMHAEQGYEHFFCSQSSQQFTKKLTNLDFFSPIISCLTYPDFQITRESIPIEEVPLVSSIHFSVELRGPPVLS